MSPQDGALHLRWPLPLDPLQTGRERGRKRLKRRETWSEKEGVMYEDTCQCSEPHTYLQESFEEGLVFVKECFVCCVDRKSVV